MLNIRGDLNDSRGNQYVGHQVLAAFIQKAALGDTGGAGDASTNGTGQLWQPAEQRAAVAADGAFVLALPGLDQLNTQEPLRLRVLAPDGEVLTHREYDLDSLPAEITISVDAKVFFEIEPVEDPLLGRQVKLTGRVLDAAGERRVANTQVILWARLEEAGADDFRPVLAARTDPEGYFSGDYPAGEYAEAYGVVNVGDNEQVPIRLENGTFPKSVVLVVEVPPDFSEEGGGQIPRAPDSEELTRASSTYSEDLAGGQCVSFTVPNRTLEEFSFYTVVRITEPEIKGLTLTEPNRIKGQVLANVLGLQSGTPATVTPVARALLTNGADRETNLLPQDPDGPDPGELLGKLRPLSPTVLKAVASDPDRFTPTALMTTERYTTFRDITSLLDLFKKPVPGRAALTVENPVDWDDEPTFYQATTIAHGHILNFKQVFKADGYSLGTCCTACRWRPARKNRSR